MTQLGGKVVEPKTEIPGQGWYAVIDDTEGNQIGLYENAAQLGDVAFGSSSRVFSRDG